MDAVLTNFANGDILAITWRPLLAGLAQTMLLSLLVIPLGAIAGLLIAALFVVSAGLARVLLMVWIDFFRAFPPLVLLIYLYFGAPLLGYEISAYAAIAVSFTLNTSSYFAEIFRAGIEGVPRGQWHAARATGMSWLQSFFVIVLPQGTRAVLPDLLSNIITITQLTALASVVSVPELLHTAQLAQATSYNVTPIIAAAVIYLALLWPLVRLMSHLDARRYSTKLSAAATQRRRRQETADE
ncbi:MAG: polar amino acid transporter permease [Hyphomicrobiales bacterium]|nr:polar amino acid transporter permease [Hyphomicrobiales bacterium]